VTSDAVAYRLRVDLRRDETYAPDDPDADLTPYVVALRWNVGMASSFDDVAAPAELNVTLANGGDFDPERPDARYFGRLHPGALVRLEAEWQGNVKPLFIGRLKRLAVAPEACGARFATLLAQDILLELLDAEYTPPLMLDARVDQALLPLFEQPLVPWPYAARYWLLGVAGSAELGTTTRLYRNDITAFEQARTTLAYAGDHLDRGAGVSAQGAIRDFVAAEAGGRFFWDAPEGRFAFHSRAHDVLDETISGEFDGSEFIAGETVYAVADTLVNALTVNYTPRQVGADGSVLWSHPGLPLRLAPGAGKTLLVRYHDPDNPAASVAALNVIPPVRGLDVTATETASGAINRDDAVRVYARTFADRAEITVANDDPINDIYVQTLRLRGTPLIALPAGQARATDAASIATHERHEPQPLFLRAVDDAEFAGQIARFTVNRFKDPVARFARVSFMANESETLLAHALERRTGDKIRIANARLAHDADYVIVGQRHTVRAGGDAPHHVTWVLAPLSRTTYWRVSDGTQWAGYSRLDVSARLML